MPRNEFDLLRPILQDVLMERDRQNGLHPGFPEEKRLAVLVEEIGEIAKDLCEGKNPDEEITHAAAVCLRWLEHLRHGRDLT